MFYIPEREKWAEQFYWSTHTVVLAHPWKLIQVKEGKLLSLNEGLRLKPKTQPNPGFLVVPYFGAQDQEALSKALARAALRWYPPVCSPGVKSAMPSLWLHQQKTQQGWEDSGIPGCPSYWKAQPGAYQWMMPALLPNTQRHTKPELQTSILQQI